MTISKITLIKHSLTLLTLGLTVVLGASFVSHVIAITTVPADEGLHVEGSVGIDQNLKIVGDIILSDDVNNISGIWKSDGSIGIGTATPTAKLDVQGDAKISGTLAVGGSQVITKGGLDNQVWHSDGSGNGEWKHTSHPYEMYGGYWGFKNYVSETQLRDTFASSGLIECNDATNGKWAVGTGNEIYVCVVGRWDNSWKAKWKRINFDN